MKTLEAANKFELEHKPAEAKGKVYLTQEIWYKKSPKAGVSYYSSLSMKVLYNLSSCELKKKQEEKKREK